MEAEFCAGTDGFSNAEMGEGVTGGTEAEMGPAGRGNAGAGAGKHSAPIATLRASLLNGLLPVLLADEAAIRSSGYTINLSVSMCVTPRNIVLPSPLYHDPMVQ